MAFLEQSKSRRCCSNPRAGALLYGGKREEFRDIGRIRSASRERSGTSSGGRPFIGCGQGQSRRKSSQTEDSYYSLGKSEGNLKSFYRYGSASERLARKAGVAPIQRNEARDADTYGRVNEESDYSWLQSQVMASSQVIGHADWSLAARPSPSRNATSYDKLTSTTRSRRDTTPSQWLRPVRGQSSLSSSTSLVSASLNNEEHKRITSKDADSCTNGITSAIVRGLSGRIGSLDVGHSGPSLTADSNNRSWYKYHGELAANFDRMGSEMSVTGSGQDFHSSLKQYRKGFLDRVQRSSRVFPLEPDTPDSLVERSHKRKAIELGVGSGTCGLLNLGNTCYQNATIQVLAGIPHLVDFFHTSEEWKKGSKASRELGRLVNELWSKPHAATVKCDCFLTEMSKLNKRWGRGSQEDANEFLVAILGVLQDDCNRNTSKPAYKCLQDRADFATQAAESWEYNRQWYNSIIDDIFGFQLHSEVTCSDCYWKSSTFDYTTELELPIPERSQTTLERCLIDFSAPEVLSTDNQWYCNKCKKHVQATKKLSLFRMPCTLLVTLKRFSGDPPHSSKNTSPIFLEDRAMSFSSILSPYSKEVRTSYNLCAVVDHSGSTTCGHYTARVRNPKNKRWYKFNDCDVREVDSPSGYDSSVYTLVFQKT